MRIGRHPRSGSIRRARVNVVIEVPVGGEPIKYEMDKGSRPRWWWDRFLYTAMR